MPAQALHRAKRRGHPTTFRALRIGVDFVNCISLFGRRLVPAKNNYSQDPSFFQDTGNPIVLSLALIPNPHVQTVTPDGSDHVTRTNILQGGLIVVLNTEKQLNSLEVRFEKGRLE